MTACSQRKRFTSWAMVLWHHEHFWGIVISDIDFAVPKSHQKMELVFITRIDLMALLNSMSYWVQNILQKLEIMNVWHCLGKFGYDKSWYSWKYQVKTEKKNVIVWLNSISDFVGLNFFNLGIHFFFNQKNWLSPVCLIFHITIWLRDSEFKVTYQFLLYYFLQIQYLLINTFTFWLSTFDSCDLLMQLPLYIVGFS